MNTENISSNIPRGTTLLVFQAVASSAMGFLLFFIMLRFFDTTEMGVYSGIVFLSALLNPMGSLGLNFALPRFISFFNSKHEQSNINRLLRYSGYLIIGSSVFLTIFLLLFAEFLSLLLFQTSNYTILFVISSFMTGLAVVNITIVGILSGYKYLKELAVILLVGHIFRIIVSGALVIGNWGPSAIFIGWIINHIIVISLTISVVFRKRSIKKDAIDISSFDMKHLLKFSLPLMVLSVFTYLTTSIDKAAILGAGSIEDLGIYTVATTLITLILSIIHSTLSMALIPVFSSSNRERIKWITGKATKYLGIFVFPVCSIIALGSPYLLQLMSSNPSFLYASLPLSYLAIGLIVQCFVVLVTTLLISQGYSGRVSAIFIVTSALEFIFVWFSTNYAGINGASLAKVMIYIVILAFLYFSIFKTKMLQFNIPGIIVGVLSSLLLLPILGIIWIANTTPLLSIIILVSITPLTVLFSLNLTGILEKQDIILICKFLPRGYWLSTKIVESKTLLKVIGIREK